MNIRLAIAVFILAAVLVVLGLPAAHATTPPTPVAQQRIVYVTPDYALYSILSTGSDRTRLTEGGSSGGILARPLPQQSPAPRYTWPTWSPDGHRLVASQTSALPRGSRAALAMLTPPSRDATYLHTTGRVPLDRVADGAPHYALWSPTGQVLSLIAPNAPGTALDLTLIDPADPSSDPPTVLSGAPIYHTFSPDGTLLAIHHRDALILRDSEAELSPLPDRLSVRYRTPSFSADSTRLAFVADTRLTVRDIEPTNAQGQDYEGPLIDERTFMAVPGDVAFDFSPTDPNQLAVAVRPTITDVPYAKLVLLDVTTGAERDLYTKPFYAFWWSPDSTKIALVSAGPSSFTWDILDIATGEAITLAEFFPTEDFITYIQFFDQFSKSHRIWSEDSSAIVFAGSLLRDGQRDPIPRAWLLHLAPNSGLGSEPAPDSQLAPVPLAPARQAYFIPTGNNLTHD